MTIALNEVRLLGVKRTCRGPDAMPAFDPKRTFQSRSPGKLPSLFWRTTFPFPPFLNLNYDLLPYLLAFKIALLRQPLNVRLSSCNSELAVARHKNRAYILTSGRVVTLPSDVADTY